MFKEIFADSVSSVHWTGNLIRMDFATAQPQTKSQDGQAVMEVNSRVIMPMDSFLKAFELQQNVIRQLLEAGVITINDKQEVIKTAEGAVQN